MAVQGRNKPRKGTGMKGHTIKGGQKRPTKSGAGMTAFLKQLKTLTQG